jgi:GNAT superfamily N-acetyltransferase
VTEGGGLSALGRPLERAQAPDLPALVALQKSAYAKNRPLLGVEPLPLLADYDALFASHEIWLARGAAGIEAAIILELRPEDLLLWSIATAPSAQGSGLGRALLGAVDMRARQVGRDLVRLYTGTPLKHLIDWYGRNGYAVEQVEHLTDRSITHMAKRLR